MSNLKETILDIMGDTLSDNGHLGGVDTDTMKNCADKIINNQNFDAKIFYQIMAYCYEQKWNVGKVVHVGNNHFEMEMIYSAEPLAGSGGIGTYTVQDGKVICVKEKLTWMS